MADDRLDEIFDELETSTKRVKGDDVEEATTLPDGAPPRTELFVCDEMDGDMLCAKSFETAARLHAHKLGKHRDRSNDTPTRPGRKPNPATKDKRPNSRQRKPAAAKAAEAVIPPSGNRTSIYASGLNLIGLGAYFAIPPFDAYDLDIVTAGSHGLAAALDQLGAENPAVRRACDVILGGGIGGGIAAVLIAASQIAVPIAAHHGAVPPATGEKFASQLGHIPTAPPAPPQASEDAPSPPSPRAGSWDPATMTSDDVVAFMSGLEPTVMFDLPNAMTRAMGAQPDPTVVTIPNFAEPPPSNGETLKPQVPQPEPVEAQAS